MILPFYKKQSGFSLVETLVAISILLIVIVGPMTISMRTAKSSTFASEQVQAFFLAQEGLELAKKARDELVTRHFYDPTNLNYRPTPWANFTDASGSGQYRFCYASTGCGLSWAVFSSGLLSGINCNSSPTACRLYLNTSGYPFFVYGAGAAETKFARRIYFTDMGDAVAVRSVVTWRTGSLVAEQNVTLDTYLYNTYAQP